MKKISIILVIISFAYQTTSNFWILTSFYIQRDYIAENICVNRFDAIPVCKGQCYLTAQLKDNSEKNQNIPKLLQNEIQLYFQKISLIINFNFLESIEKRTPSYLKYFIIKEFITSIFHPPN